MAVAPSVADSPAIPENELPRASYRGYILFMCLIIGTLSNFDKRILSMLLTPIKAEFALSDGQVGLLVGIAFAIPYTFLCIPVARLADVWSRRNVLAIAVGVWSAFTLACGYVQNFVQLFLGRVGVGAGESGGAAPMQALISDNFPQRHRGKALSIYLLGPSIGVGLGTWFGGWALTHYDWRTAFIIAAIPGLIVAPIIWLTLPDRRAGFADGVTEKQVPLPFGQTLKTLLSIKTLPFMLVATMINSLLTMGLLEWVPQMLERTHGLSPKEFGGSLGLAMSVGSIIGHIVGGPLADWQAKRDARWHLWQPAVLALIAAGILIIAYTGSANLAIPLFGVVMMLGGLFAAPMIYMMTSLAPVTARATSAAIALFGINIIGLGLGPWIIGGISDLYAPAYGVESLRMAMLTALVLAIPVAICFFLASRHYRDDLAAARTRLTSEGGNQ
jgi:predicted MFS family arabinose efflux permease